WPLLTILSVQLVFRFLLFILGGEIGVDTYRINFLAHVLIEDNFLSFSPTIVPLLRLDSYSEFPVPISQIAAFSILTKLSIEHAILLNCMFLATAGIVGFWLFAKRVLKFGSKMQITSTLLYVFSPIFLKFTEWTISGRSIFFALIPFTLYISELLVKERKSKITILKYSILNLAMFFLLIFSHRLAMLHLFYIATRYFVEFILNRSVFEKRMRLVYLSLSFSIIGLILFILPIILQVTGASSFVYLWFLEDIQGLVYFYPKEGASGFAKGIAIFLNYSIIFFIRTSFVLFLSFFEIIFTFPRKYSRLCFSKDYSTVKLYLTMKFIIVPWYLFIYAGPYIYQMVFILFVIMATFSLRRIYYWLKLLANKLSEINPKLAFNKKVINSKYFLVSLLILFTIPGLFIEINRYDYFALKANNVNTQYITAEVKQVADYLSENFENETFLVEYELLSFQLAALCPTNRFIPNYPALYVNYGFMRIDQEPFLKEVESFPDLYEFILAPFTYQNIVDDLSLLGQLSLDSEKLALKLMRYQVSYVIIVEEGGSGILYSQLYQRGEFNYTTENYRIVDMGFFYDGVNESISRYKFPAVVK
ncbi:MAG: hypothetical protein ACFFDI_28650, partial [Promethearchaeota archaeon]